MTAISEAGAKPEAQLRLFRPRRAISAKRVEPFTPEPDNRYTLRKAKTLHAGTLVGYKKVWSELVPRLASSSAVHH